MPTFLSFAMFANGLEIPREASSHLRSRKLTLCKGSSAEMHIWQDCKCQGSKASNALSLRPGAGLRRHCLDFESSPKPAGWLPPPPRDGRPDMGARCAAPQSAPPELEPHPSGARQQGKLHSARLSRILLLRDPRPLRCGVCPLPPAPWQRLYSGCPLGRRGQSRARPIRIGSSL